MENKKPDPNDFENVVIQNDLFNNIFALICAKAEFIDRAAKLDGGWEGWLQAELAVHLSGNGYCVAREADTVYSDENRNLYQYLLHTYDKPGNGKLAADLLVSTPKYDTTAPKTVVEIKCQTAAMTADHEKGLESSAGNKVAMAVAQDCTKLLLGFDPSKNVNMACVVAVVTSYGIAQEELEWLRRPRDGYAKKVPNWNLWLFMWQMKIDKVGKVVNDNETPSVIEFFAKYEDRIRDIMNNSESQSKLTPFKSPFEKST